MTDMGLIYSVLCLIVDGSNENASFAVQTVTSIMQLKEQRRTEKTLKHS